MTEKEEIVEDEPVAEEQDQENVEEIQSANGLEDSDAAEIEEVDELEQTKAELAATKDQLLRLAAEFENFKKRLERERGMALKFAEEQILKELLPSIDNMERAIEQGNQTHNAADLLSGVELTYKGMLATLEKFELVAMQSIGEQFDPNIHEALAMEESDGAEPNCVLREFQKGYMLKDKLLRPAKVVVAKK